MCDSAKTIGKAIEASPERPFRARSGLSVQELLARKRPLLISK
jgi:hypothetical protein